MHEFRVRPEIVQQRDILDIPWRFIADQTLALCFSIQVENVGNEGGVRNRALRRNERLNYFPTEVQSREPLVFEQARN